MVNINDYKPGTLAHMDFTAKSLARNILGAYHHEIQQRIFDGLETEIRTRIKDIADQIIKDIEVSVNRTYTDAFGHIHIVLEPRK